jgi:activator of HSP90 ATPase
MLQIVISAIQNLKKYIYTSQLSFELSEATKGIKQTVFIPATPDQVYDAYIDAKKHSDFTGGKATSDPKVGGKFTAWDGYIIGKNLELIQGKKIVQEWTTTEWPKGYPPSILELSFISKEEGTELIMNHSKVPAEQVESYRQGWIDYYLEPLKEYFRKK